jgi:hypothetical protein
MIRKFALSTYLNSAAIYTGIISRDNQFVSPGLLFDQKIRILLPRQPKPDLGVEPLWRQRQNGVAAPNRENRSGPSANSAGKAGLAGCARNSRQFLLVNENASPARRHASGPARLRGHTDTL